MPVSGLLGSFLEGVRRGTSRLTSRYAALLPQQFLAIPTAHGPEKECNNDYLNVFELSKCLQHLRHLAMLLQLHLEDLAKMVRRQLSAALRQRLKKDSIYLQRYL